MATNCLKQFLLREPDGNIGENIFLYTNFTKRFSLVIIRILKTIKQKGGDIDAEK